MNGYVRTGWPTVTHVGGRELLHAWYDRPYEYAWAMAYLDRIQSEVGRPLRVLDVGPGAYQPWIDELAQRGHVVAAVDLDQAAVDAVRVRLPSVAIGQFDGKTVNVEAGFDLVTCLSVVEHDSGWRSFVQHLLRARRLLLTVGVVAPGERWEAMYLYPEHVEEMLSLADATGVAFVDAVDPAVPPDALLGQGCLLTFAMATEARP